MAEQQLSVPSRARYVVRRSPSGVMKVNEFQSPGYTIVGNHLAQHRQLSATAIGLATHIQSLPEGSPVDIKTLSRKFPEGRDRIAAALRELEAHGYIERVRERTDRGEIVTVTISYNNPEATRVRLAREAAAQNTRLGEGVPAPEKPEPPRLDQPARPALARSVRVRPVRCARQPEPPRPARTRVTQAPAATPASVPPPHPSATTKSAPPVPATEPVPAPGHAEPARPAAQPAPAPRRVQPPLPQPLAQDPERQRTATALLADLRRDAPCLLLSERDVHHLAPAVTAWLERGAAPDAVRRTLTANLPQAPRHPAGPPSHHPAATTTPHNPHHYRRTPGPTPELRQLRPCLPRARARQMRRLRRTGHGGGSATRRIVPSPVPRPQTALYGTSAIFVCDPCYGGAPCPPPKSTSTMTPSRKR